MGADGWSYSEVLPYFIKSEGNDDPQLIKSGIYAVKQLISSDC